MKVGLKFKGHLCEDVPLNLFKAPVPDTTGLAELFIGLNKLGAEVYVQSDLKGLWRWKDRGSGNPCSKGVFRQRTAEVENWLTSRCLRDYVHSVVEEFPEDVWVPEGMSFSEIVEGVARGNECSSTSKP